MHSIEHLGIKEHFHHIILYQGLIGILDIRIAKLREELDSLSRQKKNYKIQIEAHKFLQTPTQHD